MPIFLKEESNEKIQIEFPIVTFDNTKSIFTLTTIDNIHQFDVEYTPNIEEPFNLNDFDVFFFSNQYLNAENDVFEVYEKELKTRIGWIFPIQVLVSNDNDFHNNKYLNKYKHTVFKKLLHGNQTKKHVNIGPSIFNLTDFYHDNIIIFALSKHKIGNKEFLITNYLPSFSSLGYYTWNEGHHHFYAEQQKLALTKRGNKRIYIQKSNIDISQNAFFEDLYSKHLKSINHFLLKFYLLYQVIEWLMEDNFDSDFTFLVKEYNNEKLSKNDLKERINTITKERQSINSLFDKIEIESSLRTDFIRDCKLLLENFYSSTSDKIGDSIYNTRNLVVHRYREIIKDQNSIQTLELITHQLELIINNLIINYETKTEEKPLSLNTIQLPNPKRASNLKKWAKATKKKHQHQQMATGSPSTTP